MRKLFWAILIVAIIVLTLGGYVLVRGQEPPAVAPRPTPTPPPPPPLSALPPEERAITYDLTDKAQLAGLGMKQPRELTAQEKDRVIQIALQAEPALEKISQGYTYRTELDWLSYDNRESAIDMMRWGYRNYNIVDAAITYFPSAKIGLGTPQEFEVSVAVDLGTDLAVYAIIRPDRRVSPPPYMKPLTEEEKTRLTTIASQNEGVKSLGSNYKNIVKWFALGVGGGYQLPYDIIEKGVPAYVDLQYMTIYPAVKFSSESWTVAVAVDLKTGKTVYTLPGPIRRSP